MWRVRLEINVVHRTVLTIRYSVHSVFPLVPLRELNRVACLWSSKCKVSITIPSWLCRSCLAHVTSWSSTSSTKVPHPRFSSTTTIHHNIHHNLNIFISITARQAGFLISVSNSQLILGGTPDPVTSINANYMTYHQPTTHNLSASSAILLVSISTSKDLADGIFITHSQTRQVTSSKLSQLTPFSKHLSIFSIL